MKSPPKQIDDDDAHDGVESFIKRHARNKARAKTSA
jgi:hypothetical protein